MSNFNYKQHDGEDRFRAWNTQTDKEPVIYDGNNPAHWGSDAGYGSHPRDTYSLNSDGHPGPPAQSDCYGSYQASHQYHQQYPQQYHNDISNTLAYGATGTQTACGAYPNHHDPQNIIKGSWGQNLPGMSEPPDVYAAQLTQGGTSGYHSNQYQQQDHSQQSHSSPYTQSGYSSPGYYPRVQYDQAYPPPSSYGTGDRAYPTLQGASNQAPPHQTQCPTASHATDVSGYNTYSQGPIPNDHHAQHQSTLQSAASGTMVAGQQSTPTTATSTSQTVSPGVPPISAQYIHALPAGIQPGDPGWETKAPRLSNHLTGSITSSPTPSAISNGAVQTATPPPQSGHQRISLNTFCDMMATGSTQNPEK